MTYKKLGKDLKVGDILEDVWWQPKRDVIVSLKPYKGPLEYLFSEGAQLAEFAILKSGMTIDNSDYYELVLK